MACSSCGTKKDGLEPAGCGSNGTCGTSGCNALNVYDWFKDMDFPDDFELFNIVEVRYKGSRKEYFRNINRLELFTGDYVITEGSFGYDLGTVSASGEIVRLQLKKNRIREDSDQIRNLLRKANDREIEKFEEIKTKENPTLERARTIAFDLNLAMKLSDIEYQGDGRKVTFFYTAESRVDFRELIRRYADEFRVKIEMRHISYREEASRLGGIGDCGRELCCSTWLTDYKVVTTGAARVQNLSINMEKLAGQCGRLKCCLNYELDTYVEALNEFPKAKIVKLDTVNGMAYSRKTDILKRLMWFAYDDNPNWIPLRLTQVNDILDLNKNGQQAASLMEISSAAGLLEKAVSGGESEMINNDELLREDGGIDESMRKRDEKDQNRNKNARNKNRNHGPQNTGKPGGNPTKSGGYQGPKNSGTDNRPKRPDQRGKGQNRNNRGNQGPKNN
jgi:cell fate regulator YaaT (PSP1 superfamily)